MNRPSLLRRAAAATLGATQHPVRARTWTPARNLTLARRAAAATLGIRSYQHTRPAAGASPTLTRIWETRNRPTPSPAAGTPDAAQEDNGPPHPALPRPPRETPRPNPPAEPLWLPAVVIGTDHTAHRPPARRNLVLLATAAVLALAFAAFSHHTHPLTPHQPSSHITDRRTPPTPAPSSPGTGGDVPEPYLGTWTATIANATGNNTRTLIVSQGKTGKAALTLTADGPTAEGGYYHCVFAAILTPAPSTDDRLHFGPSTVISGDPSYCKAGMASTLTLHNDNQLQRTTDTDEQTITYTRAR